MRKRKTENRIESLVLTDGKLTFGHLVRLTLPP